MAYKMFRGENCNTGDCPDVCVIKSPYSGSSEIELEAVCDGPSVMAGFTNEGVIDVRICKLSEFGVIASFYNEPLEGYLG